MIWYYTIAGGHTHVRVFMNGGKCGNLVFRNEEFNTARCALNACGHIKFIEEKCKPMDKIEAALAGKSGWARE